MGTSFGATTSGIVWVDKGCLWFVNGCHDYHRPIITSTTQTIPDITAARACTSISPTRFWSWEFKKLIHLNIQDSSIYWFAGSENNATTGMTARRSIKPNWLMADRQKEQRTCLIPHERALRPLSSNVSHGFSRLCVFEKWASQFGTALLLRITNIIIGSFISEVMHLICTKWGQVNFNLHLQDHISVIQKIIMGSGQFLR